MISIKANQILIFMVLLITNLRGNKDLIFMNKAITLGMKGSGRTSPNPCVGCVIVDVKGNLIGEGYHSKSGNYHAEIEALMSTNIDKNGSTAYVSLEPCNHYGRTPPCTLALIK